MAKQKRPRRQRKSDRLLSPGATPVEIECDYGVAPLDREAQVMDLKWGIDQLPTLVSPDMAAKYGRAMAELNGYIADGKPAETAAAAQNCIKGLRAMDAWAEQHGCQQATGAIFEFELEGDEPFKFGVYEDDTQWEAAKAKRPDLMMFSKREVANALKAYVESPLVAAVQEHFPAARITKVTRRQPIEDEIGF